MQSELLPTQAPTFQLGRIAMFTANTVAYDMARTGLSQLPPLQALEAMSSVLLQNTPEGGIEVRNTFGYSKIIAEGFAGDGETQPNEASTFLGAMTTGRFVVEVVRDQTRWDRIRGRRTIVESIPFGDPLPGTRKPNESRKRS